MKRIVAGSKREEALSEVSDTKVYDKRSNFDDLELQQSRSLRDRVYVFIQAESYSKQKYDKLETLIETNRDVIILTKELERVPKRLRDSMETETRGTTDTNNFMDKTKALRVENPDARMLKRLRQLPLEYLLERLSRLEPKRFPEVHSVVDFCNQRLYEVDDRILYDYIGTNITIRNSSIFRKSHEWKEYESLVKDVKEVTDKSEQEVKRNLRALVASNYEKLDLSDTQREFLEPFTETIENGVYESSEARPQNSAETREKQTVSGGLHDHL